MFIDHQPDLVCKIPSIEPDSHMYLLGVTSDNLSDWVNRVQTQLNHVLTQGSKLDVSGDWDQQANWSNRGIPLLVRDDKVGSDALSLKEEETVDKGQAAEALAPAKRKSTGGEPAPNKKKTASKTQAAKSVTGAESDKSDGDEEEESEEEEEEDAQVSQGKAAKKVAAKPRSEETGARAPFKQPARQSKPRSEPAKQPPNLASGCYNVHTYQWSNMLHNYHCSRCGQHHLFDPLSCLAFCKALDQHSQAYVSSWGPLFSPIVLHWWLSGPSKADRRNFMRTLVPKSLWSCLSQQIPGSTRAEHKAMPGLAQEERVKHLDKAVHQAHEWLCSNPLPWDPIIWAHPPDPLNPFSVSHGAFSTSIHMPPRTRPAYQNPPLVARLKTPNAHPAAHPHHAPPPPRLFPALLSTHAHGNHKNAINHHKPIRPQSFGRPQSAPRPLCLSHPHTPRHATVKHAYLSPLGPPLLGAQVRLPLPPPTPEPPGSCEIFSAHPATFCPLLSTPSTLCPFLNPPPPPQGNSAFI